MNKSCNKEIEKHTVKCYQLEPNFFFRQFSNQYFLFFLNRFLQRYQRMVANTTAACSSYSLYQYLAFYLLVYLFANLLCQLDADCCQACYLQANTLCCGTTNWDNACVGTNLCTDLWFFASAKVSHLTAWGQQKKKD